MEKLTLGARQELFSLMIAKLIIKIYDDGYSVRCGDFWAKPRSPLEHKANSLHYDKCAGDLNLFKDGQFLTDAAFHLPFANYWESLHPNCRNGRRYGDSNHYEVIP